MVKQITFSIREKPLMQLDTLAEQDSKTRSGFILWLVQEEIKRRDNRAVSLEEAPQPEAQG